MNGTRLSLAAAASCRWIMPEERLDIFQNTHRLIPHLRTSQRLVPTLARMALG